MDHESPGARVWEEKGEVGITTARANEKGERSEREGCRQRWVMGEARGRRERGQA